MTAQVNAALAAGRSIAPGTRLVGADGVVGVVRADRTVALAALPTTGESPPLALDGASKGLWGRIHLHIASLSKV